MGKLQLQLVVDSHLEEATCDRLVQTSGGRWSSCSLGSSGAKKAQFPPRGRGAVDPSQLAWFPSPAGPEPLRRDATSTNSARGSNVEDLALAPAGAEDFARAARVLILFL